MQTANEELRDRAIAHEIMLGRYYSSVTKDILKLLRDVEKDLTRQLKTLDLESGMTVKQIDDRLQSVRGILAEGYSLLGKQLINETHEAAIYEQEWQQKSITASVPINLDFVTVAPATLFAAIESQPFQGKILKEWIDKLDADSFDAIQTAVRMGLVEGQSYEQVTKRITGTKRLQYTDGIYHLNHVKTQALVSTAMAHSNNVARSEFYKANDDLINGYQWVATLDQKTTNICKSRDGKVYPLDSNIKPPAHFRCRSSTVPVLKSWREMGLKDPPAGTRASMDGQVAQTETYQTWLEKKPAEFQDEVLGKARAEMFRKGMPLDRFVDDSGKTYTLAQLRMMNG